METSPVCADLPSYLSNFVDTFVDFSVSGGLFLLPATPLTTTTDRPPEPPTTLPSPHRLIAIGDLHGDLNKTKQALRLAGLIDSSEVWNGGSTTVVQVGDIFDRGGDEIKILYFLEKLKREAVRHGGSVITMIGNHEVKNIMGNFRHTAPSALEEFETWAKWFQIGISMKKLCLGCPIENNNIFKGIPTSFPDINKEFHQGFRARIAALRHNGPISARFLSNNPAVLVIGDSVFVHGGLLEEHVSYGLEQINKDARDWINGLKGKSPPDSVWEKNSLLWLRIYSSKKCDCATLEHVLETIPGAKRMIMGHTIQKRINGACDNRAIRIDVGMSKGCGNGFAEVLEIIGNTEIGVYSARPVPLPVQRGVYENKV
ncbi:hypothetical protein ACHQM5_029088 [Ranunculus cassubicifolius]